MKAASSSCLVDSHADGLCLFGDLPESEEQADLLSLVQEQRVTGGLGFQESLQSLNGLFHLEDQFMSLGDRFDHFITLLRTQTCYAATVY